MAFHPDFATVLPMYMGVIPPTAFNAVLWLGAPHVYGGDPLFSHR